MAGILGYLTLDILAGTTNADISTDLDNLIEGEYPYDIFLTGEMETSQWNYVRVHASNNQGIIGQGLISFFDDFYNRIHVFPSTVALGTVAVSITKPIQVWNAFTDYSAELNTITITGANGVTVEGTVPFDFNPLQEITYNVKVESKGDPTIFGYINFNFTDFSPLPVLVTGTRAIIIQILPEVPVDETWEWLTNIFTSVNGTEQRVCLRNSPRRSANLTYKGLSLEEVRVQHRTLLTAGGKMFIPYMQWATQITQPSALGTDILYFATGYCDLRIDDYALVMNFGEVILVQVIALYEDSIQIKADLDIEIKKNAIIIPCFSSAVDNNQTLKRNTIDTDAEMTLSTECLDTRQQFTRPGHTAELTTLEEIPILTRRPYGKGQNFGFDTGQIMVDNKTGNIDLFSLWLSTKETLAMEFVVHRFVGTACNLGGFEEMDYWRLFFDTIKGSFRSFFIPSYRSDQDIAEPVPQGADSIILEGASYADVFFPSAGFNYIALTSELGVHYARVLFATKNTDGNSTLTFDPPLPDVAGWENISMVSYLRRVRLGNDKVSLEHEGLETTIKFNVRTVAE